MAKYIKYQGVVYRKVMATTYYTAKEVLEHENKHGNSLFGYDAVRFLGILGDYNFFEVKEIPLDLIEYPDPEESADQPLFVENEEDEEWAHKYAELSTKIPPVIVNMETSQSGKKYKLHFGRHRTRSAYLRGLKTVPAFVPVPEKGVLEKLRNLEWKPRGEGSTLEFADHRIDVVRTPDRDTRYRLMLDGKPLWGNVRFYTLEKAQERAIEYLSAKIRGVDTRD